MCCSKKISKILLFIFNIGFFLLGAAALALGIWLIVDKDFLLEVIGKVPGSSTFDSDEVLSTTSFLESGAYMLIAAGGLVFIIAFCGLCGGIRESNCLLFTYAVFVTLILAAEIAAGVLCYFYGDDVENYLLVWIQTLITDKYVGVGMSAGTLTLTTDNTGVSTAIDYIQVSLKCCGAYNYTDYTGANNWPATYTYSSGGSLVTENSPLVPISCCKIDNPDVWVTDLTSITFTDVGACLTTASSASTNTVSCSDQVKTLLDQYSTIFFGVGIGVALTELFGIMAACCLIRNNKKENSVSTV